MSIYSGFATRFQQQAYDQLILDLIGVLQRRIIKFYVGEDADEIRFHQILFNISHGLAKMEQSKYLQPKLSSSFKDLLSVTTAVAALSQPAVNTSVSAVSKKASSAPQQTLNFSVDKLAQDLNMHAAGKIRHQLTSKDDISCTEQTNNPQKMHTSSSHLDRRTVRDHSQRWAAVYDSPPALPDQQRKHMQYVIKEYISRGQQRRKLKRKD